MKFEPFVSVIVPAYNEEKNIGNCLDALLQQSYPQDKYEIIVVDDGSTDKTLQIVQSKPKIISISQKNQGPASARNTGVAAAKGSIILFTDADCEPDYSWIEKMVEPFANEEIIGVKGIYRTRQTELMAKFSQYEFEDRYDKLKKSQFIDFVDSHSAGFRKDAFLSVGGFDPHFPIANNEDVDLSYKLSQSGGKMVFQPEAVVYHRHPARLVEYLHLKFLRAYWRIMVYKKYPSKIIKDSYTPQTLKIQIILAFLVIFSFLGSIYTYKFDRLTIIFISLFCISCLPFLLKTLRKDPLIAFISPAVLFLRSIVFSLGVLCGILSKSREDLLFPSLLIITDIISVVFSFVFAFFIRNNLLGRIIPGFDHTLAVYLGTLPVILIFWIAAFAVSGLYRTKRSLSYMIEYFSVIKASGLGTLTLVTVSFFMKYDYSRLFIVIFFVNCCIFVNLSRSYVRKLQLSMFRKGYNSIRVIILGCGETGRMLYQKIKRHPELGYHIIGFVDDQCPIGEEIKNGVKVLGNTGDLINIIQEFNIDEVFIAKPELAHDQILDLVASCDETKVGFKIISDLFEIITSNINLEAAGDIPVVDLAPGELSLMKRIVKRTMDLILASIFLISSLPLWIIIAILIKLDSPGPIFFCHERVGRFGKRFKIYKFRTMYQGVNPYDLSPRNSDDKRITKIGRILRRTSLDELPQFINVLKGDMSLVGPRPEMPFIVEKYRKWEMKRLNVRPGMTGLWQILGRKDAPLEENIEYDFYYIKNQSLLMDISILLKTLPILISGKGAF